MRRTSTLRVLGVAAAVAASVLAVGTRAAHAATEEVSATIQYVQDEQELSPLVCSVGPGAAATWTCSTPSTPIVATGIACVQNATIVVAGQRLPAPQPNCRAELAIPSSGLTGPAACANTSQGRQCNGAAETGFAYFTFEPLAGSPVNQAPATITDAACTPSGGHATVTSNGTAGTSSFAMTSTLTWVGSCFTITDLTWAGTVSEVD